MANKIEAAIFVRVSTRTQDVARQIDDLTELCQKQGWILKEVITEKVSGNTKNSQRPGLQRLMTLATTGGLKFNGNSATTSKLKAWLYRVLFPKGFSQVGVGTYFQAF